MVHLGGQVAVGRGDDLAAKLQVVARSQLLKPARLKHTQQLHLNAGVQFADFVEEYRSVLAVAVAFLLASRCGS